MIQPMEENRPLIQIRDLKKSFGSREILKGINLDIPEGKTTVVVGSSGHGKSTVLKMLIGALLPDSGQILYDGRDVCSFGEEEMDEYRLQFGMLFQGSALLNSLTVGENVALPLREHSPLQDSTIEKVVKIKLELVGLRGFEDLMPDSLSGGMKKRVGLARAIVLDPRIVFYDEPQSGLDPITTAVIDKLIVDLTKKLGITSLVITHDMKSAFSIADNMAMLYEGKIIARGTPEEVRQSGDARVQQFIQGMPDGPIPLNRSKERFLTDLFGIDEKLLVEKHEEDT
jgi:phospholipid/cholesterol/gamma-HCH transport system ATP-binding protein